MSPRTRGFNDVPSPHDSTGPRSRGDKQRPMGAPPPRRVESLPLADAPRGPGAGRLVLGVIIAGLIVVGAFWWIAEHPSPPPTQPTETHTVIEVPQ